MFPASPRLIAALFLLPAFAGQGEAPPSKMLQTWLMDIARRQLAERRNAVAAIHTRQQLEQRQAETRTKLLAMIGGLPEAAPSLDVKRTGRLDRGDYRVEKLIFQGQPGALITANLYIPQTGKGPYPAILHSTGHSAAAKNRAFYQTLSIGLVKQGFVVLVIDPLGQGERRLFWDRDLEDSKAGPTTVEHEMVGLQSLLAGESIARQFIRDGMRGIDLLESLPEVDSKRIGITGCSGGGTLTAYLAALDPRVSVAAPACYVTSWEEQLKSGAGPQDAEQEFPDMLRKGFNHADLVNAFAPKPYLICSTDQDFFPLEGARRTYTEAQRMWALAGAPDRIAWFHEPGPHGTPKASREAIYGWMRHWLQGGPAGPAPEPEFRTEYEQDLNATPTGQLATSLGGETASTIDRRRYAAWPAAPKKTPAELRETVFRLTRAELPVSAGNMPLLTLVARREGYQLLRLVYHTTTGRYVPALLTKPDHPRGQAILYVGDDSAAAAFKPEGDLDRLAAAGYTVLAIDVAGRGETTPDWEGYSTPWFGKAHKTAWLAMMVGRPLVGAHVLDIASLLSVLGNKEPITGFGKGVGAVDLLHAALLDKRIHALALERMLVSYRAFATSALHRQLAEVIVPGVLGQYDLPELAASLAPRKVWLVDASSPMGHTLPLSEARAAYASPNVQVGLRREPDTVFDAFPGLR